MINFATRLSAFTASVTLLLATSAQGACLSQENELTMLMCEINSAHEINDLLYDICFCPAEIDDEETYWMFEETVRPNANEIIRTAAQHPSLFPVPDYVLNDEVRNW